MVKIFMIYLSGIATLITIYIFIPEISKIALYLIVFALGVLWGQIISNKSWEDEKQIIKNVLKGTGTVFIFIYELFLTILLILYHIIVNIGLYMLPVMVWFGITLLIGWNIVFAREYLFALIFFSVFLWGSFALYYYYLIYVSHEEVREFLFDWTNILDPWGIIL